MQYPVESLKSHIVNAVGDAKPGISGSDLMDVVRTTFPEFAALDYGCVNLRDFIRRLVPEVVPIGRRGMDYVYALAGEGNAPVSSIWPKSPSNAGQSAEVSIWKTFASPSGVFKLLANKDTGRLCVCPPGAAYPDGFSVEVPPLPAEKHIEIATDYIATLSDEGQKERLRQYLDKPQWWMPFYQAIQKENLAADWNAARRKRIVAELRSALTAAGVPVGGLEAQLTDRIVTPLKRSEIARQLPGTVRSSLNLRTIATAIVQNMSITELRELRVSLGDVFDALER
jgi:hypothetical protein